MRRVVELDAVRGIAALFIVMGHVGLVAQTEWFLGLVDLFFVVSGFLITANVLKESHAPGFFRKFFVRRALRIWPLYYVALGACLILNRYLPWDDPARGWASFATFTQYTPAYWGGVIPPFSKMFAHSWTLAIEEQFYLVWPFLVHLLGRRGLAVLCLGLVAGPAGLRAVGLPPILLGTRCDGLALGALLALLAADPDRFRARIATYRWGFLALGGLALFGPAAFGGMPAVTAGGWAGSIAVSRVVVAYFSVIGLVVCLAGHPGAWILRNRWLGELGRISYSLYLLHPLVFAGLPRLYHRYVIRKLGLTSHLLRDLILMGLSLLLAIAARHLIEEPFLRLKDRFRTGPGLELPSASASTPTGASPAIKGPHAGRGSDRARRGRGRSIEV